MAIASSNLCQNQWNYLKEEESEYEMGHRSQPLEGIKLNDILFFFFNPQVLRSDKE